MNVSCAQKLLGGTILSKNELLCPGPGHSIRDTSLSVTFNGDEFVVYSHAGDDWRECRDYVKERLGITQTTVYNTHSENALPASDADKIRFALQIWSEARRPHGTIVERYLASRGIVLDDDVEALRFHPRLRYQGQETAGMVCLFTDISGDPCGIHRTFIDGSGRKIDRKMLGRAKGAAIKLEPYWPEFGGLHIGEGVETCLAARMLDFRPSWALGSADAIASFPLVPTVQALTLFRETDKTGANERAVRACAERYLRDGREVYEIMPAVGDMNDSLREAS